MIEWEGIEMKIINILGTEYTFDIIDEKDECMKSGMLEGYTDHTLKKIIVHKQKKENSVDCGNQNKIQKTIARHEIIHAFLFESGIDIGMQFHSEEMVDWLAMQLPKINTVIKDLEEVDQQ